MPKISGGTRGAINEIIDGKLYQRGQILTWQREKKYEMLKELGIQTVVNFWPKQDPDMAESPVVNYLQISAVRSEMMLEERIEVTVDYVSLLLHMGSVLVLCEAGKTRSVYFCVLLVAKHLKIPARVAMQTVFSRVGSTSLKPGMLDRINEKTPAVR